jgi:hypothetical protein
MGARRDEEWAPPVRLRRWGVVVESRTDVNSTSRLARWLSLRTPPACPLAGAVRAAEPDEVKRLGNNPAVAALAANGGARVEVATPPASLKGA